jgi:hypothetical protein
VLLDRATFSIVSEGETPTPGDDGPLAGKRRAADETDATSPNKGPDEATRITRIVLIAVILVLVGGLALLLVFGPAGDNSARDAFDDLGRSQVSIRDSSTTQTTDTSEPVSTDTAAPAETAPPGGEPAVDGPSPPAPAPPAAPPQSVTTLSPARLETFYAVDSQGRLPVRVGQSSQISIRNSGGSEGAWALNATGSLRVNGQSGINGRVAGGSITVVTVTVDPGTAPDVPTEATIRFDTPDGESKTILVQISP